MPRLLSLLVVVNCVTVINTISALQVRRREQSSS